MRVFFTILILLSLSLQAIDLTDPNVACGGEPCKIRNAKTCPAFAEYNTDQDMYRNYIIDGVIYAKDHRYYAKGGSQKDETFFPTKPGYYVILYSNKIHDMGLVVDMNATNDDSANMDKIQFHSFAEDGPQLPYATDDDHLLLTTAKMSSKHTNFLTFNLYTKYVNGIVPRITGLKKMNQHGEGIEFCLRGFGLMKYNNNHGAEDHDDLSGITDVPNHHTGHWKPLSPVAGFEEGERDYYEFGTMDLQFTGDIYVKEVIRSSTGIQNYKIFDSVNDDGLYLTYISLENSHFWDTSTSMDSNYARKFQWPIDYGKWALYYQMPKDHADEYKGRYPLLSMHPASVAKKNLIVRKEITGDIVGCYHYATRQFIRNIASEEECIPPTH